MKGEMLMNALSHLEVLREADQGQAPPGQRREGARPKEVCWDEAQPQDEGASEGFIDGAGI
jgi:hypothetical protein